MSPNAIARVRPTHGAVANATPPTDSIITPYRADLAERGRERDLVARQRREDRPDHPDRRRPAMSIAKATAVTWPASFSSAIVRRRLRRRRQQVEAALGRLAGQRPGQRDDRPQAEHDRQEVADAPGQEAAHRARG